VIKLPGSFVSYIAKKSIGKEKYSTTVNALSMHIIHLALGTNLGNRTGNLRAAIESLPPSVVVQQTSRIYETQPWGVTDQPAFLNMVLQGKTHLSPLELLAYLKNSETKLGRTPTIRWGPRLIDMDILFYDDLVLDAPGLTLPHPHLHGRAFVLVPLMDIAPDHVHPVLGKSIKDLLAECDRSGIKRIENDARNIFNANE
jgi:2-amino-4-hydroxy-6-hydroxymethyldihydropteridine diphosphokinase